MLSAASWDIQDLATFVMSLLNCSQKEKLAGEGAPDPGIPVRPKDLKWLPWAPPDGEMQEVMARAAALIPALSIPPQALS